MSERLLAGMQPFRQGGLSLNIEDVLTRDEIQPLLSWSIGQFSAFLEAARSQGENRMAVWVACFPETRDLQQPTEAISTYLSREAIFSNRLYLIDDDTIFIEAAEEYRIDVSAFIGNSAMRAYYRSWRFPDGHYSEIEFYNDVYIWSAAKFDM